MSDFHARHEQYMKYVPQTSYEFLILTLYKLSLIHWDSQCFYAGKMRSYMQKHSKHG